MEYATQTKVGIYTILTSGDLPGHWPLSSINRLRSVISRVLPGFDRTEIEQYEVLPLINKVLKSHLKVTCRKSLKQRSLITYRSVLVRYVAEKLSNRIMLPWEAMNYLKSLNKKAYEQK